jgi:hypothetical protein
LFSVGTRPMKFCQAVLDRGMFTIPRGQAKLYVLVGQAGLLKDLVYATETTPHWAERSLSVGPQIALYRRKITDAVARPILTSFIHMPVSFSMTFQESRCWE